MGMRSRDILAVGIILVGLVASWSAAAETAAPEEWAVVGLEGKDGPPLAVELEGARGVVAAVLGHGGRVLEPEELVERMGLQGSSWAATDELIAEAELYFFQLDAVAAKDRLERALRLLAGEVGEEAWERVRTTRLLLAVLHLQQGNDQEALDALLPIAGVQPHLELDEATTPADLQATWSRAKAHASTRAEGWLRIRCEPSCAGARVWGEAIPLGPPETSIALMPGTYRVVVNHRVAGKELRSLPRTVKIQGGEELQLLVHLPVEEQMRTSDGAHFRVDGAGARMERVAGIVAREVGAKGTIAFGPAADGALWVWRLDGRGAVVRTASSGDLGMPSRVVEGTDDLAALVRAVLAPGREDGQLVVTPSPLGHRSAAPLTTHAPRVAHDAPAPSSWRSTTKWASLAASAVITGIATWLTLDAAAERDELRRLEMLPGAYRGIDEARRATAMVNSIQDKEAWGMAMWGGAAVGVGVTTLLFLQDGAPPATERNH